MTLDPSQAALDFLFGDALQVRQDFLDSLVVDKWVNTPFGWGQILKIEGKGARAHLTIQMPNYVLGKYANELYHCEVSDARPE